MLDKLELRNRVHAVIYAYEAGLVSATVPPPETANGRGPPPRRYGDDGPRPNAAGLGALHASYTSKYSSNSCGCGRS
ncbi:hypothetical protein NKH77_14705 [Streptomyces sp. M19]